MSLRAASGLPEGCETLEVDGVRLAYDCAGEGQAMVCLHAVGHGGGDFAGLQKSLRNRFKVIRVDWPGQGRSGPDTHSPDPRRYARLLRGVLEKLRIEQPILIGNSIGGATAVVYASQWPVKALVLCDAGGLVPVNGFVRLFCATFAWFFNAGARGARWFMPLFHGYYRFMVLPQAAAAAQRENIIRSGYEIAAVLRDAWRGFGRKEADLRSLAQSLSVPVWFAWAKQDRVIPLSLCMPCIRQMPKAYVTRYPGGHAAFLEQPEAFIEGLDAFVASLPSVQMEFDPG